jgi:hypothetical protein
MLDLALLRTITPESVGNSQVTAVNNQILNTLYKSWHPAVRDGKPPAAK